jgi:hypothetical protein
MNNKPDRDFTDADLDRLLNLASAPASSIEGMDQLLRKIAIPVVHPVRNLHWLSLLPLAASLAIGIYLGAAGFDTGLALSSDDTVAFTSDFTIGIEDAEAYVEETPA